IAPSLARPPMPHNRSRCRGVLTLGRFGAHPPCRLYALGNTGNPRDKGSRHRLPGRLAWLLTDNARGFPRWVRLTEGRNRVVKNEEGRRRQEINRRRAWPTHARVAHDLSMRASRMKKPGSTPRDWLAP